MFDRLDANAINRGAFCVVVGFLAYWAMVWIGGASYAWLCDAFLGRPDGKFFPWHDPVYPLMALVGGPLVMAMAGPVDLFVGWLARRWTGRIVAGALAQGSAGCVYFCFTAPFGISALCFFCAGVLAGAARGWVMERNPFVDDW